MKTMHKRGTAIMIAAALALGLSACGGGSGGNLTNEIRDLKKDLADEQAAHATTQASLDAANGEVTRLTGELGTANGEVTRLTGELSTANGEVTRLTGELGTASGNVTRLEGELSTANGEVTRLTGELGTANGEVTRLTGELATASGNITDLQGQLTMAQGEVTRLTGELGTANGEVTRLTGELGTANGEVTRLTGELGTANGEVTRLTGELETANGEVTRLTGELETANDTITMLRGQLAAESTVRGLFATAQSSTTNATNAGMAAEMAVTTATEAAAKLGVIGSAGDSAAEMANANAIMGARDAARQAVMDAQAALDAANTAKTTAEGLEDDNPQKMAVIEALDAAIEVAEAQLKSATADRDSDSLSDAVEKVEGSDGDGTPAKLARAVAMAIGEALGGMDTAAGLPTGTPAVATDATSPPASTTPTLVLMNDAIGKTWIEIVGEANTIEARVGTGNTNVKLGSVAGMMASAVDADITATGGTDGGNKYADGFTEATATTDTLYRGIPGTVHCLGTDCEVDANGNLKGSWYFTPTSPMVDYVKQTDDESTTEVDESKLYEPETLYAQFGHWLTMVDHDSDAATPDRVRLNRYAATGAAAATLNYAKVDGMPDSATYSGTGNAIGRSVHKVLDSDGDITRIDSGAFTADAELILRFGDGADITLGGTIDNFQSDGANVDSSWTVELERTTFTAGDLGGAADDGKTVTSGRDGEWTATAYGAADARPTGIFGAFNAHFSDGHAAGVYATRK